MSVINPDHLLDQADRLIASGAGAPRQADLRRAISSVYYALFHAVATEAADEFVGSTHRSSARYALVYRSVEHQSLRKLCENVTKQTLPKKYSRFAPKGGFGTELIEFANLVTDLYEKRHSADYDPLFRVRTSDVTLAVSNGRNTLRQFRTTSRTSRKTFIALLLFAPRSTGQPDTPIE